VKPKKKPLLLIEKSDGKPKIKRKEEKWNSMETTKMGAPGNRKAKKRLVATSAFLITTFGQTVRLKAGAFFQRTVLRNCKFHSQKRTGGNVRIKR
jgi:hypothetical protein